MSLMSLSAEKIRTRLGPPAISGMFRLGLPWPLIDSAYGSFGAAVQPLDTIRRFRTADALKRHPAFSMIPRSAGYKLVAGRELPGLDAAAQSARRCIEECRDRELKKTEHNPFYPVVEDRAFSKHPDLVDFALSDAVIAAVTGYFGMVPRLSYLGLWLTRPNTKEEPYHSQLAHLDKPEVRLLTLFVNASDVLPENGPFTFFSGEKSRDICRAVDYEKHSFVGGGDPNMVGRIEDADLRRAAPDAQALNLSGPCGTAAFVDTSKCIHYGSRCRQGERMQFAIRFTPAHRGRFGGKHLLGEEFATDPLRRLVLGYA